MADTGPVLTGLSIAPYVNVTQGDAVESYTASATDASSTITSITVHLDKDFDGVTYDTYGGTYTYSATNVISFPYSYAYDPLAYNHGPPPPTSGPDYPSFPDFAAVNPSATYSITDVVLADAAGNTSTYTAAQLQTMGFSTGFTIESNAPPDTTPPVLTSLTLPPVLTTPSYDPGAPSGFVYVGAADAGVGVDRIVLNFDGGLAPLSATTGGYDSANPALTQVSPYEVLFSPGPSAETGDYHVVSVTLYDRIGNAATYTADQLAAMGVDTSFSIVNPDTTAPVLTGLGLPSSIDVAQGASVAFSATATDFGYGVASVTLMLDHAFESGGALVDEIVIGGAGVSFAYQGAATGAGYEDSMRPEAASAEVTFDASTALGAYGVSEVIVTDKAGNTTDYTPSQLRAASIAAGFRVVDSALLGSAVTATGDNQTLIAPVTGEAYFQAGGVNDTVILNGNVNDYTLSRVQSASASGATDAQNGAFLLTATNGSGAYAIEEGIATVRFQNGQYLALKDLPDYVHGDVSMQMAGGGNDLLYQTPSTTYELFIGGGGQDDLYLNGNVQDYTLKTFNALTAEDTAGQGGHTYSGLELVATNGSGDLLIDSSVETVHFQNGQYLAYGDLHAYVAANGGPTNETLDIGLDGDAGSLVYQGASGVDRALLNGNASSYTLSRDVAGDFVLDTHTATNGVENTLTISQAVETVQFANGQYLALKDLGAYVTGSDVFTQGTAGNDLLFTPSGGDSFVVGGAGVDNLFLTGNTRDYTIQSVDLAAQDGHPAIDGYELVADNGSGNIYIDSSVETVHFQNGQYLAFHDLPSYVELFHG